MDKENAVAIQGILLSRCKVDNINTLPYDGYELIVSIERTSGVADTLIVYSNCENVDSIGVNEPILISGKIQAYKNFFTGKVLVYILADLAQRTEGKHWIYENEITLNGMLGEGITYRETPRGSRISDLSVLVENELKALHGCYIPCIAWNNTAAMVKSWRKGDRVALKGKLQSRMYTKHISTTQEEQRVAYEVSIYAMTKIN